MAKLQSLQATQNSPLQRQITKPNKNCPKASRIKNWKHGS